MNILITGITGFIGSNLANYLVTDTNNNVAGTSRTEEGIRGSIKILKQKEFSKNTNWIEQLSDVEVVVHTAARVHVLKEHLQNPREEFLSINTEATINLAKQAAAAGVKKFVFLSSIGVNGTTTVDVPFNEDMRASPTNDYALSKHLAEKELLDFVKESPMDIVIIRPPLVYGINAPGNFAVLLKIISKGIPLPFRLTRNKRSFISIENLTDFISKCITDKRAANEIFVISDGDDISTPELIQLLANGMKKKPRLFPFPDVLLKCGALLTNKMKQYQQLCGSMQIDISKARNLLNWEPVISNKTSLKRLAEHYHAENL